MAEFEEYLIENSFEDSFSEEVDLYENLNDQKVTKSILFNMFNDQIDHSYSKFSHAYIKYRKVVAEWIIDVCDFFKLHLTTTHAAISYLDRLQPNENFSQYEWQMMAISCILISSKYNECEEHVPCLSKLEEITNQAIPNSYVLNFELWALKRMSWKLNVRSPIAFLHSFYMLGVLFEDDQFDNTNQSFEIVKKSIYKKFLSLSTKCLLDIRFKSIQASAIASAILHHSRSQLDIKPHWRPELTKLTMHDPTSNSVKKALEFIEEIDDRDELCQNFKSINIHGESKLSPEDVVTPVKRGQKEEDDSPVTITHLN